MGKLFSIGALIVAIVFATVSGAEKPRTGAGLGSEIERSRFSHIRGMVVENRDAEKLGEVKDFVLDLETAEIKYAIMKTGGFLGVRSSRRMVPAQILSNATAKKGTLVLDVGIRRWKQSPQFKRADLATLNDPQREKQIAAFYGLYAVEPGDSQAKGATTTSPGSSSVRKQPKQGTYRLASDIVGREVIIRQHEGSGKTFDLLIDLSEQKPPYVLITASIPQTVERRYAVPLRAVRPNPDNTLLMGINPSAFAQAQPFDDAVWQKAAITGSSLYYYAGP
jgi:sporulation protein YlmC with PRC-barrel domain